LNDVGLELLEREWIAQVANASLSWSLSHNVHVLHLVGAANLLKVKGMNVESLSSIGGEMKGANFGSPSVVRKDFPFFF
jgi:hypothetical protein